MPTSRVIMALYAFTATANIAATARGPASLAWATTPLLFPLLVAIAVAAAHETGQRVNRVMIAVLAMTAATHAAVVFTAPGTPPIWVAAAFVVGQFALTYAWITGKRPRPA